MKVKIMTILLLVIFGLIVGKYYISHSSLTLVPAPKAPNNNEDTDFKAATVADERQLMKPPREDASSAGDARSALNSEPITEERMLAAQTVDEVWHDINPSPALQAIRPKSDAVTEIKAIEIENIEQFRVLATGDAVTVTMPDNQPVNIQVTSSEIQNEGVRTWSGQFELDGEVYPATFTFGKTAVLGFIGHPSGQVKLEGNGSEAWVYRVPPNHGYDETSTSH